MKRRNILIIILFCLALFAVPTLFFLQPKKSFSEREKRYLADAPELSAQSLADGTFTGKLGSYVADHFPGREFFVGVNAYFDLLSGRQATREYFPKNGRLFARPVEEDREKLDENLEILNEFARDLAATEADIPLTLMLVPSSGAVLLDRPAYPDGEILSYVYERAEMGHVDLLAAFRAAEDPDSLYYRTDHHWTSEGAFLAACAYRRSLNLSVPAREDYTVESYEPFYGSAYAASGLWLTKPDSLELWSSGNAVRVSNEGGGTSESVFYRERLEEQDKYTVFLDGNHSQVRIERADAPEDGRCLLVIRDSYSNSLGCFLADLYDKVILLDLRYYKLPLTQLLLEENVDEILIEYSVDNFLHESNLAFLSLDPEPVRQKVEELRRPPNYLAPPKELTEEFFDGAYYLGDSVNGILRGYCLENGKLVNTTIGTNALLSFREVAELGLEHLAYKGEITTLPAVLEDLRPRMLIVALGCNDLAAEDTAFTEEKVRDFLALVREYDPELPIILQSVMPVRADMKDFNQQEVDEFNAWLKENAEALDYCYLALDSYFKDASGNMEYSLMYNATHLNQLAAPIWYEQLLNLENYYHFPEALCLEYDGVTGLPVEPAAAAADEAGEAGEAGPAAPAEPDKPAREETLLDRIYARICEELDVPEMLELTDRTLTSTLGLQPEEFMDGRFYLCANNLKADEIWLLELENQEAAAAMLKRAQERITVKADSYAVYLPEESDIIRHGAAVIEGRYVALFLSPDADAMKDLFLATVRKAFVYG